MRAPVWALLLVIAVFVAFVLGKYRARRGRAIPDSAQRKELLGQLDRLVREAQQGADRAQRGHAWVRAARLALEELGAARLALRYARRAERECPDDPSVVQVYAQALMGAQRYDALEHYLWKHLSTASAEHMESLLRQLTHLYDGPLRRKDWARALQRITQ
jgi:hypothetical protein